MFGKLTDKILGEYTGKHTITGWIAGFTVIVLIRSFLEMFSNTPYSSIIASESQRVHYYLFYVAIIFSIAFTVTIFTRQKGPRVISLAIYGLPIIFLAPIIDLVVNTGKGVHMGYLFDTHTKLLVDFLTFFGANNGATAGIRIEIFIILCAIGWYVWMKRKNFMFMLGAIVVSYTLIFIMGSLPGILYTVSHIPQSSVVETSAFNFIEKAITVSNIPTNILHGSLLYGSYSRLVTLGLSTLMSQLFFIISFIAGLLLFWYTARDTTKRILENSRPERVSFYISLIALGALYAHTNFSVVFTWIDWVGLVVVALSWFSACMFAIHVNDIADIEIDAISNPLRPLPQKTLSVETMRDVGFMWLALSLVGSYIAGYYVFFMNIVFTSAYYLYSAPPLRLKQVPVLSSFLISIACLATILAGFFFVSPNKMIETFPMMYAVGIVVVFTLGVNIRDIKDIEGDRATGVRTLPVIFGDHGKQIVGALLSLSLLLAPMFFSPYVIYTVSIPSAIAGYWLCTRQPYKENYIFILFFAFCVVSILLYPLAT